MKSRSRDSSHSPVGLGHELFFFVLTCYLGDYLLSMDVGRFYSLSLKLGCFFILLLNSFDFLLLNVNRCNFHSKNDILNLRLCQTCNIDIILLGIVCQNKIFQLDLNFDPLLICESWPDMMRLCNDGSLRHKNYLCSLRINVERSQDQNETTESCEALDSFKPIIVKVKQKHLWLCSFEDSIAKFLNFED